MKLAWSRGPASRATSMASFWGCRTGRGHHLRYYHSRSSVVIDTWKQYNFGRNGSNWAKIKIGKALELMVVSDLPYCNESRLHVFQPSNFWTECLRRTPTETLEVSGRQSRQSMRRASLKTTSKAKLSGNLSFSAGGATGPKSPTGKRRGSVFKQKGS